MIKIRVATWNVRHNRSESSFRPMMKLLRRLKLDLLTLQEVKSGLYQEIQDSENFAWGDYSIKHFMPRGKDGSRRSLGCAVFGSSRIAATERGVIRKMPLPERTFVVRCAIQGFMFSVASVHIPPGVTWDIKKQDSFRMLSRWAATNPLPVIIGMDANEPEVDHPDLAQTCWWSEHDPEWQEAKKFFGERRAHPLNDLWRKFLKANPRIWRTAIKKNPMGPLALTFMRGPKKDPCRYDYLMASENFIPRQMSHLSLSDCQIAGSDHSLVYADLKLQLPPS